MAIYAQMRLMYILLCGFCSAKKTFVRNCILYNIVCGEWVINNIIQGDKGMNQDNYMISAHRKKDIVVMIMGTSAYAYDALCIVPYALIVL